MIEILLVLAMEYDIMNTQIVTTDGSMGAKLTITAVLLRSSSILIATGH